MTPRPWIVGHSSAEPIGSSVTDGFTGRITDPVTGAGLFQPNLDPNVTDIDPLTGSLAPDGTDVSFGAAVRRQVHTNVVNGDFAVMPPDGEDSVIDCDPSSATYNPLPGWTWTPASDGLQYGTIEAGTSYGSPNAFRCVSSGGAAGGSVLEQWVAVPASQGQQYRVLLSAYGGNTDWTLRYRFYRSDTTTAIGSEVSSALALASETKVDAGLVPKLAAWMKLRIVTGSTGAYLGEVRAAFLPAEATLGLRSIPGGTSAITTTQTQVAAITVPAGTFTAGSVYRITAFGEVTSGGTHAVTIRVRIGTTTLTGNIAASSSPTATATANGHSFAVTALVTIWTVGAGGTADGGIAVVGTGPGTQQPFSDSSRVGISASPITVDTTVANILELTAVTANAATSVTFHQAVIECVMAS